MRLSQDVFDLGDDVFGVRTLSLQDHAVPHPLLVQPGQLHLGHRQAHAALLPASTKKAPHAKFTPELLLTLNAFLLACVVIIKKKKTKSAYRKSSRFFWMSGSSESCSVWTCCLFISSGMSSVLRRSAVHKRERQRQLRTTWPRRASSSR